MISSLPGSVPGKLDIKRHSPSVFPIYSHCLLENSMALGPNTVQNYFPSTNASTTYRNPIKNVGIDDFYHFFPLISNLLINLITLSCEDGLILYPNIVCQRNVQGLNTILPQRGSFMVWEISMGVCPRLEFDNIMFINCLGYDFYIYGAIEFLCNSIANL